MEGKIAVSELFGPTIQGEGATAGTPAYFLRTRGCNLLCEWCDTIEVWKKGTMLQFQDIVDQWDAASGRSSLADLNSSSYHLVITGGEPLQQQDRMRDFIRWLNIEKNCYPVIEVETNGTIRPKEQLCFMVTHWNVSPKLNNSGEPGIRRINPDALSRFKAMSGSIFKFVIVDPDRDWNEICQDFILPGYVDQSRIWLMPAANTREELCLVQARVADLCKREGVKLSSRLQLVTWDMAVGV